jgi:hypothetical protein
MRCPALYGYRFSTAKTVVPRATMSPSSSLIFGMRQNGQSWSPVGLFSPRM